jgi:hypothetical protein
MGFAEWMPSNMKLGGLAIATLAVVRLCFFISKEDDAEVAKAKAVLKAAQRKKWRKRLYGVVAGYTAFWLGGKCTFQICCYTHDSTIGTGTGTDACVLELALAQVPGLVHQ